MTEPFDDPFGEGTALNIRHTLDAALEFGDSVELANDEPYINRLNDGWSDQGSGFIEAAEAAGSAALARLTT